MTDVPTGQLFLGETIDGAHQRTGDRVLVKAADLTTHGVIVGMTGSGKTGLGVGLVEEALLQGIPTLVLDPKGDLGNLLLAFPDLSPESFAPWVEGADPTEVATTWREGLASWGIDGTRIQALRDAAHFTIYTPGSTAGVPLNVVGSLQRPPEGTDEETMGDEVQGYVSGLLDLVGIEADPLASREHILLSNLVRHAWDAGHDLDLASLVAQVQSPPLRKLGVFELDEFFPADDRTALAMRLNGLLASPAFAAWGQGTALDIDALLRPSGRPGCAIVSLAHLSDEERQFVVTLVLGKLVTWMRRQPGTDTLRAFVYFDEVVGFVPPSAAPPAKAPILTLLKQARAFGVGLVLATQNPVDVDYKALSNAGTWMIGRLQTEQDK
ncbi:MAG: ATP-binding protein, partial [Actinomycetota bacterium]